MRGSDEITHPRTEELAGHPSTRTFATIVGRFFCASCAATVDACSAHRATPRSETLRSRGHGNEAQQTIAEIESLERIFAAPDTRPLGPATSRLQIEDTTKCTRIACGFAFGSGTPLLLLKLNPVYCLRSSATFPSSANIRESLRIPIRVRRPSSAREALR